MGFYEEISKYYDYIFPTGNEQIKFIKNSLNKESKKILDIACGSGSYSIELAKLGYHVTAVDLDQSMIDLAKSKARELNVSIKTHLADMLKIDTLDSKFHLAFCIGNSLAHLNNLDEINSFLSKTFQLLDKNGVLILQIINFDRVIEQGINSLPTINNEEVPLTFERNYILNEKDQTIFFHTILSVENKKFENKIPLLPIQSNELIQLLNQTNYTDIETFGDFKQTAFNPQSSYHLIIRAKKK